MRQGSHFVIGCGTNGNLYYCAHYRAAILKIDFGLYFRTLLRKLYEALFPPHFSIGSPHTLSPELAQEFPQARSVITVWLCDWLNRTAPSTPDSERVGMEFPTNLMRATRMAMLFDQRSASNNLHRIPCSIRMRRRDLIRYPNIYVVHDLIESVMHNTPHALNRGVLYLK